jgi:hypothetical protein
MAMSSLHSPPTWFSLDHYQNADRLDFEGWRIQIGNRIYLDGLARLDTKDQFDQCFKNIIESPFFDFGFADVNISSKAVYPLTFGVANAMVSTLALLNPDRKDSCDQRLRDDGQESFAMHAHLTIDFNASKAKIIKDFEAWLVPSLETHRKQFPRDREAGMTKAVCKSWHEHKILPYQDLKLWFQSKGLPLPSDTILADWLYPDGDADKDKARTTREKAESAYNLTTLRQLSLAAG